MSCGLGLIMSRISKNPIQVPDNLEVKLSENDISVKGPLGDLSLDLTSDINVDLKDKIITVNSTNGSKHSRSMSGTIRTLISNMIHGVSAGFEKKLTLVGVGYRAQVEGDMLNMNLGFSHPVIHKMPSGVKAITPSQTEIVVKGIDKQQVGQVAAEIRAYRKPEPYKGKGVRYADERIILKEAKKK